MVEVTFGPGKVGVSHRHPGPAFVYVIEGTYELGIDDQPTKIFKAGETFQESSGCLHRVSRNPAASGTTRLIAVVLHPRDAKDILGRSIVEQYYSTNDAERASDEFRKRFSEHMVLENTEVKTVPASSLAEGKIGILNLIKAVGYASSTSEARRLVEGRAVSINGEKVEDVKAHVAIKGGEVMKVGKLKICKLSIQ